MTAERFRRLALALDGALEGAHMNHPDFRANGRIFATIHPDPRFGMVKLSPDEQTRAIAEHPDVFSPESGAWGRQGCTRVEFAAADEETLGEVLTLAWQAAVRTPAKSVRASTAGARPRKRARASTTKRR
jgi:hypothetical protein